MNQIVTTRYRDIPFSEVESLHHDMTRDHLDWSDMRGRELLIVVPALPDTDGCGGPWFRIHKGPVKEATFVCPHLAEIGD